MDGEILHVIGRLGQSLRFLEEENAKLKDENTILKAKLLIATEGGTDDPIPGV